MTAMPHPARAIFRPPRWASTSAQRFWALRLGVVRRRAAATERRRSFSARMIPGNRCRGAVSTGPAHARPQHATEVPMTTDNAAVTLARAAYRAAVEQAQAAHIATVE